ncbi:60S ribosomal protein L34 [Nannizzia gypsea CBS 118893]|uniref:60S ribosomal protein L34 n=1 Tax=Arthroderma gypseum (strain ATCC MYA-4604 / CBS 118893) TaxID=535722 RepID=E4UW70_ARTGP|nr:60S ribosomal protein L34 [Nannizzia gypsea CBS 118893]EFR01678.1 60S ribosomal protein L34 [Nannizzia gypsea CBS 118893]
MFSLRILRVKPFAITGCLFERASSNVLSSTLQNTTRSFSALNASRPTLSAPRTSSIISQIPSSASVVRPNPISSCLATSPSTTRGFSSTASLGVKRDTYNPSRRVQKRRHGFLARVKSRGGRGVLARRRSKQRKYMSW